MDMSAFQGFPIPPGQYTFHPHEHFFLEEHIIQVKETDTILKAKLGFQRI